MYYMPNLITNKFLPKGQTYKKKKKTTYDLSLARITTSVLGPNFYSLYSAMSSFQSVNHTSKLMDLLEPSKVS